MSPTALREPMQQTNIQWIRILLLFSHEYNHGVHCRSSIPTQQGFWSRVQKCSHGADGCCDVYDRPAQAEGCYAIFWFCRKCMTT